MRYSASLPWFGLALLVIPACATGTVVVGQGTGGGGGAGGMSAMSSGASGTSSAVSGSSSAGSQASSSSSSASSAASSSSASSTAASSSSSGGPTGCVGCTASLGGPCASNVVVVGHYTGGARTVCIQQGDNSSFSLALMSYETTNWTLSGATGRITKIQVYTYDAAGMISGNAGIPTSVQVGGAIPADPYNYAMSMADCAAHTGYAGAVFGVPQAAVCDVEQGLPGACGSPSFSCLSVDP
jgi:hypothetical protein